MRTTQDWPSQRFVELNRRLRLAFVRGAEEHSHLDQGRGLTEAELRAVLERYPGDVGGRLSGRGA
jgi:hypothetical protein